MAASPCCFECEGRRCTGDAVYGFTPGEPKYCAGHNATTRNFNVVDIRCQVCGTDKDVCYGVEARRPVRCGNHRTERDIRVWPAEKCGVCDKYLIYGLEPGKPLLCAGKHQERPKHYWNVSRAPCIETNRDGSVCQNRPVFTRVPQGNGEPELCDKHKKKQRRLYPEQNYAKVFVDELQKVMVARAEKRRREWESNDHGKSKRSRT